MIFCRNTRWLWSQSYVIYLSCNKAAMKRLIFIFRITCCYPLIVPTLINTRTACRFLSLNLTFNNRYISTMDIFALNSLLIVSLCVPSVWRARARSFGILNLFWQIHTNGIHRYTPNPIIFQMSQRYCGSVLSDVIIERLVDHTTYDECRREPMSVRLSCRLKWQHLNS